MRIQFILSKEETNDFNPVNNFTVANAIYNACIESNMSIAEKKSNIDARTIAKMLLLQCDTDGSLLKEQK